MYPGEVGMSAVAERSPGGLAVYGGRWDRPLLALFKGFFIRLWTGPRHVVSEHRGCW